MTSETSALARDSHPTDRPRPTRPFTRRGHQAVDGVTVYDLPAG